MDSDLRNVLKGGFKLSSTRGIVLVVRALQTIVLASLLGPKGFGEVTLFNIIFQYVKLTGFGLDKVAYQKIPGRIALNDMSRVEIVKNMAILCNGDTPNMMPCGFSLQGFLKLSLSRKLNLYVSENILRNRMINMTISCSNIRQYPFKKAKETRS